MEHKTENFLIRNATAIAITTITVVMLLAGILFYRQNAARTVTKDLLVHTYEVTGHIQLLFNRLKDVELGQRGYLIAGNEEYLEPYYDALKDSFGDDAKSTKLEQHHSISEELNILRKLTADNPIQQQNLDEMASYVKELLEYWSASIEARRHHNTIQPADFYHAYQTMEHLRRLVSIMMAEENHLLELRTNADEASTRQSNILIIGGLLFFYIIKTLAVWFYQKSRQRYMQQLEENENELRQQQEELQSSNEEMETSNEELAEKTKALEIQNAQIQQQAEELGQANKYKSEFLANMSHELRTPLNSLLILSKLHASNESGNLTEEQVEEARIIHSGGLELLNLINDILDLSKIEAGKVTITPEQIAPGDIVSHLQQQFGPIAGQAGILFPVKLDESLPETLYTDTQRVMQILKNLLANAFKFTEKGSVTLSVFMPEKMAEMIGFSVTDTGIGIEPDKFKDIFEAFQQEDGSIDRHYGGTGLGLTIARKFAHMLGGEIHLESEKGKGSMFTLYLPVTITSAMPKKEISGKTPESTAITEFIADDRNRISDNDRILLIIEDDKNFAATVMKIARTHGYKCLCAGDGKTGLLLAREKKVTAIILDLNLPQIDGLNVLDQLKHNLRTRHIPVHVLTGRTDVDTIVPLRKGAIGCLQKPISKEALDGIFAKIDDLLQTSIKRILVIEDDQYSQVAICKLLKKDDTELTVASTGSAALAHLRTNPFDCIILDLRLPDMTGFTWLETFEKEFNETAMPPIIIYTAQDLTEEENRKLSHYTGSIVVKGIKSPERLLDEVTLFLHSVESTLPADQQQPIAMQHNPDKILQGKTILLVDDDMRNTFALSKLLKSHKMNIIIAENGRVALNKLQENNNIQLILMDIMMPIMDGYQAMREIRSQAIYQSLPIIALTAQAMLEEQGKCMEAGANDYLTKPVDIERLLTLMRVWLFKEKTEE